MMRGDLVGVSWPPLYTSGRLEGLGLGFGIWGLGFKGLGFGISGLRVSGFKGLE